MSRPEYQAPPEIYYGDAEAKKYTQNTRNQQIQADMTYRALELLNLPPDEPAFLLDIGCGSGLSGEILEEEGHIWAGVDIAPSMLEVALERDIDGDLFLQDIGQGFSFRPGSFDGAISISVLQWLLNAETSHPTSSPPHRLTRFFTTLHSALRNPSRAVFQFYPTSDDQIQLITSIAQRAGFGGGVVVDYPNSKKARKVFLCLFVGGGSTQQQIPKGVEGEDDEQVRFERRREKERKRDVSGKRKNMKDRDWILKKKEASQLYRQRGKEGVPRDSKFTGRKRKPIF
ncbi:S-adenosyl-L-methionine-dependent methyltransferase [Suillus subaureus]|uniref:S-adenosyl-L-methionine-dependent methyltransferase n=1 Tax=Suillus subaureus TaxID=48587 RepID=A0A9P7JK67_9AGAM|nr:S-adenosyl-L-methionine-dependent methyltransferase [Suillus subaureus]KAG1827158.1 S-adenosyl-L-methionine-dependent methyltransferase [Suillus subaureus]